LIHVLQAPDLPNMTPHNHSTLSTRQAQAGVVRTV
jgi:hypothetical protein